MELEVGEILRINISVHEDDLYCELGDVSTKMHDCHKTSLWSSCVDFVDVRPTSPDVIAHISPNHAAMLHVSLYLHHPPLPWVPQFDCQ